MSLTAVPWTYPSPINTSPILASTPASSTVTTSPTTPPSDSSFYAYTHPRAISQNQNPKLSKMTVVPAAVTTAPTATKRRRNMSFNPLELSQEDDWTKVKDPKEKKRIQNRVAQRTYRHRMKARLGELQARLDNHERRFFQPTTPESGDSSTSNGAIPAAYVTAGQPPPQDKMPSGQAAMMQQNVYEQSATGSSESTLFQDASKLLSTPPPSLPSPPPHGLLSPPSHSVPERETKVPQEFVLDCMRFQTQLLNRLNNLQQDPSYTASYSTGEGVQSVLDDISPAEHVSCVGTYTPTNSDGMDFGFDANVDVWRADTMVNKLPSSPISPDTLNFPVLPNAGSATTLEPSMLGSHPTIKHSPQPLHAGSVFMDDRLQRILEFVESEGFESFDALASAYYCETLNEASPLAQEQEVSRTRRLPKVISNVFQARNQWNQWQRRGLEEEILKTAESMLLSEGANARASLMAGLTPLMEAYDHTDPAATAKMLHNLKLFIQTETPSSWVMTMALASENRNSWQKDGSNTALATTLMLTFAGRVPNDTLLQLISSCL
ncbi:Transcription factor radR [Cladobotryum mycophilum]|uniref:Transcription factor radR n=1 Tax=Cladobotryum mycophilum TaxID=491253 RepID=A0ABR0S9V6_9HYPO